MILWHFSLDVDNFSKGFIKIRVYEFFSTVPGKNFDLCIIPLVLRHINPLEKLSTSSEKCHKIIMIYKSAFKVIFNFIRDMFKDKYV